VEAQYRFDLEAQIQRREVRQEMEAIRATHTVFGKYPSVADLADLCRPGNRSYENKDAVLRVLLAEIKRKPTLLFPLLNLMFWDSLLSIFRRKRRDVPNPDELFSRIQSDFFHVAVTYPLDRRPQKIDVNLILDTKKKVTAWQREEAKHREPCQPLGPADDAHIILGDPREAEVHPEDMEGYLLGLVYLRVIDEKQYGLLLETAVYRRMTQKEWAEARGVPHATARSWRYRAEVAIREYEKASRRESVR